MSVLLHVRELSAAIGPYRILHDVSLEVPAGSVTVIVGRNGAGKTTTLRTIMGMTRVLSGRIEFDGRDLTGMRPYQIARLGIGYVPEDRGIFTQLTVEENLRVAEREPGSLRRRLPLIFELFPDLERFRSRRAGSLSGGQQQMVAIARALVNENRLLLVDEPSKGLAPSLVRKVADALRAIAREATVVLVEQNLNMAAYVGDRYVILEDGRSAGSGPMEELARDTDLQRTYLGVSGRAVAAGGGDR